MWILLSSIIILIILSVWFLVRSEFRKKKKNHNLNYWQYYQVLIYEIETLSIKLNQIGIHIMQTPPNPVVLDRYESAMKLFETLLTAITKLNPDGKDLSSLKSASYLVEQCKFNLETFDKKPQLPNHGASPTSKDFVYSNFPAPQTKNPYHGKACYFCSRPGKDSSPSSSSDLVQVRVKIDSNFQTVVSCSICEEILKKTKKVKVLFFVKDGKPTHWSDLKEYIPNQDFWKLNQADDGTIKRPPKLELVYSRPNSEHET